MNSLAFFRLVLLGAALFCMRATIVLGEPYHGTPFPVPGQFEAEEFDRGEEGDAYHGEGAVVVAVAESIWGGTYTNIWEPLPRERADADITVGRAWSDALLGLRPKEWVKYSLSVETNGYYQICFLAGGMRVPETACFDPDQVGPNDGSYPSFSVLVDGQFVEKVLAAGRVATGRVWLSAGPHELKLQCDWAPTYMYQCLWGAQNVGYTFWYVRTCSINWIRIIPAAVPLKPEPISSLGDSKFLTELPSGAILFWRRNEKRLLALERDGRQKVFAGGAINGPREGQGTNVTFSRITQCVAAPNGDVFVLQPDVGTNGLVSRISPTGSVTDFFDGLLVISNVWTFMPDGWITPTVLRLRIETLAVEAEGELLGGASYLEAVPDFGQAWKEEERVGVLRIRQDGSTAPSNWASLFRADEAVIDAEYRLQDGAVVRMEDGFTLRTTAAGPAFLRSAFRARDGTVWAIGGGTAYRMTPQPDVSFLTVLNPFPGVEVKGVPLFGLNPDEVVQLEVTSKSGFWALARWSDGMTNNPRSFRVERDTTLSFEVEQRPPERHGLAHGSVQLKAPGTVRFSVIGPGEDLYAYPYRYLLEWSVDLKDWKEARGMRTVAGFGQITGSEVVAEKLATPVEFTLPDTTDRWFLRASLKY